MRIINLSVKALILVAVFLVLAQAAIENNLYFFNPQFFLRVSRNFYYAAIATLPQEKPTIYLPVKFHRQEHSLSCEIASLTIALTYQGAAVTESDLLRQLTFSDTGPRRGDIWGDPDLGFVGDIDGSMPKGTGYGVYQDPIRNLAMLWRDAEAIYGGTFERLIQELIDGNPSVVWGALGSGKDNSWYTQEGKRIKAVKAAHVRLLIGFTGPQDKPTGVILMDPLYGEIRWSRDKFIADWAVLGNRAVVVYSTHALSQPDKPQQDTPDDISINAAPIPFTEDLFRGVRGDEVRRLQIYLATADGAFYPEGLVTGYFGPLTEEAVKKFQLKHEIISGNMYENSGFGVVGPRTREKLNELTRYSVPVQ